MDAPHGPDSARSSAAEADLLFVRIAVRSGLLTRARGDEALAAAAGGEPGAASALCIARGWLSAAQVRAISASSDEGPASPSGNGGVPRGDALQTYVRLKQAVQRGAVEEAEKLAGTLATDPQYGLLARVQVDRALARRAVVEARRSGGQVVRCPACRAPAAAAGARECARCGAAFPASGGSSASSNGDVDASTPSG